MRACFLNFFRRGPRLRKIAAPNVASDVMYSQLKGIKRLSNLILATVAVVEIGNAPLNNSPKKGA